MIRTCSTSSLQTSPVSTETNGAFSRSRVDVPGEPRSTSRVALSLALLMTLGILVAPTAHAEEEARSKSAYIEYMAGVSHAPYQTIHGNSASNANLYGRSEQDDLGYFIGVAGGLYLMENFRAELQLGFRSTELQGIAVQSESSRIEGRGTLSMMTAMANAYFDIDLEELAGIDSPVSPWIGAGIGWGMPRLDAENSMTNGITTAQLSIDDTDSVFVYNAMVGLSAPISQTTSITGGYRYVATGGGITLNGRVGSTSQRFDYEYDAHEAYVGLRFSF